MSSYRKTTFKMSLYRKTTFKMSLYRKTAHKWGQNRKPQTSLENRETAKIMPQYRKPLTYNPPPLLVRINKSVGQVRNNFFKVLSPQWAAHRLTGLGDRIREKRGYFYRINKNSEANAYIVQTKIQCPVKLWMWMVQGNSNSKDTQEKWTKMFS